MVDNFEDLPRPEMYRCDQCGKGFPRLGNLTIHQDFCNESAESAVEMEESSKTDAQPTTIPADIIVTKKAGNPTANRKAAVPVKKAVTNNANTPRTTKGSVSDKKTTKKPAEKRKLNKNTVRPEITSTVTSFVEHVLENEIKRIAGPNVAPATKENECIVCREVFSSRKLLFQHFSTHNESSDANQPTKRVAGKYTIEWTNERRQGRQNTARAVNIREQPGFNSEVAHPLLRGPAAASRQGLGEINGNVTVSAAGNSTPSPLAVENLQLVGQATVVHENPLLWNILRGQPQTQETHQPHAQPGIEKPKQQFALTLSESGQIERQTVGSAEFGTTHALIPPVFEPVSIVTAVDDTHEFTCVICGREYDVASSARNHAKRTHRISSFRDIFPIKPTFAKAKVSPSGTTSGVASSRSSCASLRACSAPLHSPSPPPSPNLVFVYPYKEPEEAPAVTAVPVAMKAAAPEPAPEPAPGPSSSQQRPATQMAATSGPRPPPVLDPFQPDNRPLFANAQERKPAPFHRQFDRSISEDVKPLQGSNARI